MSQPDNRTKPCAIKDCRRPGALWFGFEGYICELHADIVWRKVEQRDTALSEETVVGAEGREYDRADCRAKRAVARRKPQAMGVIYFVLVDGLIKVGWTSKLADRVRSYGPNATLLADYPGSRADEADLHRQLTPARYRGREWYHDCDITRAFVAEVISKHGNPRFTSIRWTEPKRTVAGKHHR